MSDTQQQWIKTLEAIYREAVDAIITIDAHGKVTSINPATETLFGYSSDELLGQNVHVLMPQPHRNKHDSYIKNFQATGEKKIIGVGREVVGRRKDGSAIPVHLAVSEISHGETQMFAGVIRDLTELRRLEAQESALGRIVENSLNEIYIIDIKSLRFVQVNNGARQNLGYSLPQLQTMTPLDLEPERTAEEFQDLIQPLLSAQADRVEYETLHQRSDGSTYEIQIHLQTTIFGNRDVFVATALDITQRREAQRSVERQRASMQAELEQLVATRTAELERTQSELVQAEKYSTLGKVSGGIAHEIRNPLNAVKTSAYFLLNANQPTPEKVREHLERIDRQVSMIDNVVTALSDVAKLPEANLQSIDLAALLTQMVRGMQLSDPIETSCQFPSDVPLVLADENQIVIAFKNLIRNARDAMTPDGGTLTLSADTHHDSVTFHVTDTGCGISEQHQTEIMEPLFSTKARGMGLGLSISKTIIEKNRGEISVQSKLGQGSRFSVRLTRGS
jgi:two-component system sensor kinase FixL